MKKVLALVLALAMMLCAVSALAEGEVLQGVGISTAVEAADASADGDGKFVISTTVVSLNVDNEGVISTAKIDVAYTTLKFDAEGKVTTDLEAGFRTKKEMGDDYGMRVASAIGKEAFEQYASLEEWLVGKTVEDLKTAYEGADETLKAAASISLDAIITAAEKAVADALAE